MLRPPAGVLSTRSRVRLSSWNASWEEAVGGAVIEDAQVYASHSCTYKQVLSVHVTKNGSYLSGWCDFDQKP